MTTVQKKTPRRQAPAKKNRRAPTTLRQYDAMPMNARERYEAALRVLSTMRQGNTSLRAAANEHGISARSVRRYAGSALRKTPSGRYVARGSDTLLRVMAMPAREGLAEIATKDSRAAGQLGEYWNAVQTFLSTGDASEMRRFRGKSLTAADGTRVPLRTDLDELERLGSAGTLSFESIYRRAG